jgi:putative endonuclease
MSSSDNPPDHDDRVRIGRSFEKIAAEFFVSKGFTVLERNWQAGHKEIDLIVRKDSLVVFVEVKSSTTGKFGHPAERVDNRKIANLTKAAYQYVNENSIEDCDLRFDVVTFFDGKLEHFPNAFESAEE